MLDVYADGPILHEVVKLKKDKLRTEPIYEKIFNFLNCSCNLFVNKVHAHDLSKLPSYHLLNLFTEGKGDFGKFIPKEFDAIDFNALKPWSVILIAKQNVDKAPPNPKYFSADKSNFIEKIGKLLFQSKGQTTSFIISTEANRDIDEKGVSLFNGWQTLDGDNLLPVTDVVIVDRFFLAPAHHRHLKAYIENCLFPLFRLFRSKAKIEFPNITVFTEENDKIRFMARDLFNEINNHPDFDELGVSVGFAVSNSDSLGTHYRYIFTSYQGMDPGLSIHGFTNTKVLGTNDENFEIVPYSIRPQNHLNDLFRLRRLATDLRKKKFLEIGNLKNRLLSALENSSDE